jgi:hypothetical protein
MQYYYATPPHYQDQKRGNSIFSTPLAIASPDLSRRGNLGGVEIQKLKVKNQNDKSKCKSFRKRRVYCFSILKEGITSRLERNSEPRLVGAKNDKKRRARNGKRLWYFSIFGRLGIMP